VLISNVSVEKYNERCLPELITITFSNGEKVSYVPSGDIPREQTQLASFEKPKYDIVDLKVPASSFEALEAHYTEQLRSLDDRYKSQVMEAERRHSLAKSEIKDFCEARDKANDQLWSTLSKEMLADYQKVKKTLNRKVEALSEPSERVRMMTQWLGESRASELLQAAKIFQTDTDYILKRLVSPATKWDCFLSHVQKDESDACRNIKESLSKADITAWYDKLADRVDNRGMTDGVIDSRVFTLVLTKDFFQRPYCIYEYCLAVVACKPVIVVAESDARFGGGALNSFNLKGMFRLILSHEVIEIHRTYWGAFIERLRCRIEMTLKSERLKSNNNSNQKATPPTTESVTPEKIGTRAKISADKIAILKRSAKLESELKTPNNVTVKVILPNNLYQTKFQLVKPSMKVNIPMGGMELSKFLKFCIPNIEENQQLFWVEDKKKNMLEHISHRESTVWVKSKNTCRIIQTYLPQKNGKWQSIDIFLPKEGIAKEKLILWIDQGLDPNLYQLEKKNRETVKIAMPGTNKLWIRKQRVLFRRVSPRFLLIEKVNTNLAFKP